MNERARTSTHPEVNVRSTTTPDSHSVTWLSRSTVQRNAYVGGRGGERQTDRLIDRQTGTHTYAGESRGERRRWKTEEGGREGNRQTD